MATRDLGPGPPQVSARDSDASEETPLLVGGQFAPDADTEATALLHAESGPPPPGDSAAQGQCRSRSESQSQSEDGKPLPKLQIFLLCYVRMMEPIAFFSIFPFVAQMVQRNGHLPESDVGFYSGLIESLFSLTQTVVLIFWGRLADRVGRKPVLVWSLAGMAVGPVLFGLSTTLWQMILFRCLAGVFSGSSLVIRTMISEHSTPETQARAFSWFAVGGNIGLFAGPLIGGVLADPAEQYPGVFGGVRFFVQYPYALAGFVVGGISATGILVSALFLKETMPKKRDPAAAAAAASSSSSISSITSAPPAMTMWELLQSPGAAFVLWLYGQIMLLAFVFTAIIPVAAYTPVHLGGLGFGPSMISRYMAAQGASQAAWLLLAFPWLQRRLGTKGVLKACGVAYPFFFAGFVVLNLLLRQGGHTARVWFWIVAVFVVFFGPGVSMAFTGAQLALNDISPDQHVLGTLNAIALTGSSAIRSVAPAVATAVYAIGVRNHVFGGHLAWILMIFLALVFTVGARWLPDDKKRVRRSTEASS